MQRRILLVDDEEDTAALLAELLRRRGYTTMAVTSALECLECLGRAPVDVVITDLMMPGMSGIDLCAALRAQHPDVLVIIVSGRSTLDIAISATRAGAYDYITKPVKIVALELVIARAFEHLDQRREVTISR